MAPNPMIKTFLLLSLLLLIPAYSGMVNGLTEGMNHPANHFLLYMDANPMKIMRKLLVDLQDYDDTGPNNKHNPRHGGGRNP